MISEQSEGIPRNINNICFNALSLGCAMRQKTIDVDVVEQIAADSDLSCLRSELGIAHFGAETTSSLTTSEARSREVLNPEEALAYIREIIQRLKNGQQLVN